MALVILMSLWGTHEAQMSNVKCKTALFACFL